ncbi:hypothetical protein MMC25_000275 [Agyrium rufum]|nr:hypothetical protein [Agyrium rufum]
MEVRNEEEKVVIETMASLEKSKTRETVSAIQTTNDGELFKTEEAQLTSVSNDDTAWSIWSPKQKKIIILAASFASLLSPLSGQIYFPALDTIAKDLHVTDSLVNLSITTYVIFQAIAPTFTAQLSDTAGRRPLCIFCFILYIAANIGLGAQDNYAALLALRAFQSACSSGMAGLSAAVATDITTPAERGIYIAYAAAVPLLGPTLIERNAQKEGKEVPYEKRDELAESRHLRFPNPFGTIMLLLQRECGYALLYSGLPCCSFYAVLSLIPPQFHKIYDFNELQIALCYIPFGVGSLVAAFNRGRMTDSNFRRHAKRLGISTEKNKHTDLTNFPIERARLEVALPTIILGSACMVGFG